MTSKTSPSKAIRSIVILLALVAILLGEIALQAGIARADSYQQPYAQVVTPTRPPKAEKPTRTPLGGGFVTPESHILCGELVFFDSYDQIKPNLKPTVSALGLRRCDGGGILIFKIRPRDLVPFYQFRDAKIASGEELCSKVLGCVDRYMTTFQNYIGIESCAACGISMLPPTWTQVPLTPYTPTPIPPTRTPWPTPVSPTPSPTLSPGEITPTSNLFELLHGTETPISVTTSQAPSNLTATPSAAVSAPAATSSSSLPFYRRIGPVGLLLLALLAFLIPLAIVLRDYFRDR